LKAYYKNKNSKLYCGNCIDVMKKFKKESVNVIVTSPPYNLNIKYSQYKDNLKREGYLDWLKDVFKQCCRILSEDGSFFLNMGNSSKDPWIDIDVMLIARELFNIQNRIIWVKSISIDYKAESSHGHFTPLSGDRYLNKTNELIFHFVKKDVKIDRLADGVVYSHPSNFTRWKTQKKEVKMTRCRGNSWFIDYKTQKKEDKCNHPAIFPLQIPLQCIKLHGVDKNPIVLDPFVGIGATVLAGKILGLKSIGIDIDENYLNCAINKLEKYLFYKQKIDQKESNKQRYIEKIKIKNNITHPEIF